jgi:hypothetical protein
MSAIDKTKSTDTVSSGLVAGTRSGESALALGRFNFECIGADGKVKWTGSALIWWSTWVLLTWLDQP